MILRKITIGEKELLGKLVLRKRTSEKNCEKYIGKSVTLPNFILLLSYFVIRIVSGVYSSYYIL